MNIGIVLLIVLVLILVGVLPTWGHSANFGYGPVGIVGVILIVVIALMLTGRM